MDASAVLQAGGPPLDLELLRQLAGRFGRPTLEALEKVLV
jgi:hypothetical protein